MKAAPTRQPASPVRVTGIILGYLPYTRETELRITEPDPEPPFRHDQVIYAFVHIPVAQAFNFQAHRNQTVTLTLTPTGQTLPKPPWLAVNFQPQD